MAYKSLLVLIGIFQLSNCWFYNNINTNILKQKQTRASRQELEPRDIDFIFPGTKWCGPGNRADNYDDLGPAVETDKCCRAHDTCPEVIEAGETKYNLTNTAFYSRLSCNCDEAFRLCLRKDGSEASDTVGIIYFNVIGTQCFRKDYNATGCLKYGGFFHTKCLEYEYDTSSEKFYQWFDVPNYM